MSPSLVDEGELLDPPLPHRPLGLFHADRGRPRDEACDRGHQLFDEALAASLSQGEIALREEAREEPDPSTPR